MNVYPSRLILTPLAPPLPSPLHSPPTHPPTHQTPHPPPTHRPQDADFFKFQVPHRSNPGLGLGRYHDMGDVLRRLGNRTLSFLGDSLASQHAHAMECSWWVRAVSGVGATGFPFPHLTTFLSNFNLPQAPLRQGPHAVLREGGLPPHLLGQRHGLLPRGALRDQRALHVADRNHHDGGAAARREGGGGGPRGRAGDDEAVHGGACVRACPS